jgi:nicotinamide phosphoribosyltransferase
VENLMLCTDVYKMGHMEQYPKGTTKVYSYLLARSDKKMPETLFYGLQYYLKKLCARPTDAHMIEFLDYRKNILGTNASKAIEDKCHNLVKLGYLPIKIKAVREGQVIPVRNALMTIESMHPEFYWMVGFVESLLLKVWNTTTVASNSRKLRALCKRYADETCDDDGHVQFQVHDFGYRGCSSEETAALSGSAHLISFLGTDTITAIKLIKETYGCKEPIGLSVPASEHSVMCAFGKENEFAGFEHMLELYPTGILSQISDTYDLWNVLTNFAERLKSRILERDGKFVFRPDSGDPPKIICGDADEATGSPEWFGSLRLLDKTFGSKKNSKGYRVLNPKVGLIYGDGMFYDRFERTLETMKIMGYASSNLVIGSGGILLQQFNRDDMGFAIKATFAEVNGELRELMKDPVTDHKKKSHKGLVALMKDQDGRYFTKDQCTAEEEEKSLLETVFLNGELKRMTTFDEIRALAKQSR